MTDLEKAEAAVLRARSHYQIVLAAQERALFDVYEKYDKAIANALYAANQAERRVNKLRKLERKKK